MSPFDLTNLAALKAWLGLPSDARAERCDAQRACHGGKSFDLRSAKPPQLAAVLVFRDD